MIFVVKFHFLLVITTKLLKFYFNISDNNVKLHYYLVFLFMKF